MGVPTKVLALLCLLWSAEGYRLNQWEKFNYSDPFGRAYFNFASTNDGSYALIYGGMGGSTTTYAKPYCMVLKGNAEGNYSLRIQEPQGVSPGSRFAFGMAPVRNDEILLVGGSIEFRYLNGTWIYNAKNKAWRRAALGSSMPYMKYVEVAKLNHTHLLLFGGSYAHSSKTHPKDDYRNTTWVYDYNVDAWAPLDVAVSPPGRKDHCIVPTDRGLFLFGGNDGKRNAEHMNDAWLFSGNGWQQVQQQNSSEPWPSRRSSMSMASNGTHVMLFGGRGDGMVLDDTWVFTVVTSSWNQISAGNVGESIETGRMNFFGSNFFRMGGFRNTQYNNAFEKLVGNEWQAMNIGPEPSGIKKHAMARIDDSVVIIGGVKSGGTDLNNLVWKYSRDEKYWSIVKPMVPGTQPSPNFHSAAAYLEPGKALVFGGYYKTSYYGDTYTLSLKKGDSVGQWEKLNLTHSPKGLAYHAMAAIVGRRAVVLFGGHWSAKSMSSDTWVFSASTMGWSQISGYSPSARGGHAMASLGENKAILFGGRFGPTYNNELWEFNYDTETWRKIEQGPNGSPFDWPPSRYGALLAPLYTPNTMIMYGGNGEDTGILTDTWILWFDGASNHHWERHASDINPLNSFEGTIAPIGTGPGTGPSVEVVVFGGEVTNTVAVAADSTYFFRSSCVRGTQLSKDGKNCELLPVEEEEEGKDNTIDIIIELIVIFFLLLVITISLSVWHRKRQKWLLSALSEKEMQLRHEKIQTQKAQEGWSIQESEITLGAKVGSGSYGDVFKGKWAPLKDTPVAIKLIPFAPGERAAALDDAEMLLMQRIRHPRLVLFFGSGVLKSRNCSFMVTEFLAGEDLMEFIGTAVASNDYEGAYPWETRVRSAMDIAEGMEYLHSRDWIHRDLKSANILRDEMGRCKIADFGLSKSFSGRSNSWSGLGTTGPGPAISLSAPQKRSMDTKMEMTAFAGSGPWMAPELITSRMSDVAVGGKKVDVYSFGCVLYELVEGRLPWSDAQCLEDIFGSVEHGGRPNLTLPVPSEFKKSCIHSKVCSLMSDCWQQSASRRPSFSKIAKILRSLYKDQCRKQANMHVDRGATKAKRSKYKASALILSSDSLAGNDRASFQNPILQMVTSERK